MDLSIVIPVFNEEDNIEELVEEIVNSGFSIDYEIIVIDDCSEDGTLEKLSNLKKQVKNLRVLTHSKNSGQSTAVRNGVIFSKGKWVATLDGDGQNVPADILALYSHLIDNENGNPTVIVAGHRVKRKDNWLKLISSKYANSIRAYLLNDGTPDTGCGLKVFSREKFLELPYFDHMHRFLPALFVSNGGRVVSIQVSHRPRTKGVSKYGFHNRLWVSIFDILGVRWLMKRTKITTTKEI